MTLDILHFRTGLLALNLLGAVGVPAYAALSYWGTGDDSGLLAIADPRDLVFREGEGDAATDGVGRGFAEVFRTRLAPEPAPDEAVPEPLTAEPPAGPLAEEPHRFQYVFGIRREDPLRNFVILRKSGADGVRRGATTPGSAASPRRPQRVTAASPRKVAERHPDEISFFVADRWYWDPDQGLDFMIHSADEKELVYWLPERPGKFYALPYVGQEVESKVERDDRLPVKVKKTPFFFRTASDFERLREEEYWRMLDGRGRGPLLSPGRRP